MAAYTKIIDLYGIPACGKSTLAENMANLSAYGLKVATMRDCMLLALKNKWNFINSFTFKNVWVSVNLKLSTPLGKKRKEISLWHVLKMGAYKEYVRKYTDYDIVITDHGDIQRFVSLERGDNLHESEKFRKACLHYLDASLSTFYVYCKLNAEDALRRMTERGRSSGRIDLIDNPHKQLQELKKEANCFDFWTSIIKERDALLCVLDMKESTLEIANKLYHRLKINNNLNQFK